MSARAFIPYLAAFAMMAPRVFAQGAPEPPIRHGEMMNRLRTAAATGRVRVVSLGRSVEGRTIPLVALGPDTARARVLVLCRQHGNEVVSTSAALRIIERAARADKTLTRALGKTQLLIAPMVNPDGAQRGRRLNARQVDLNRDWRQQSQPETRAIVRAFEKLTPQVVLDAHEWTTVHYGSNSLETAPEQDAATMTILRRVAAAGADSGVPLRATTYRPFSDTRLAHRTFSDMGAAAYLLESTPAVGQAQRIALYERTIVRMAVVAGKYAPPRVPAGRVATLPALFAVERPAPVAKEKAPIQIPMVVAVAFALWLAAVHGGGRRSVALTERTERLRRQPLRDVCHLAARIERRRVMYVPRLPESETAVAGVRGTRPRVAAAPDQRRAACISRINSTSPRLSPARRAISASATPSSANRRISRSARPSLNPMSSPLAISGARGGSVAPRTASARSRTA